MTPAELQALALGQSAPRTATGLPSDVAPEGPRAPTATPRSILAPAAPVAAPQGVPVDAAAVADDGWNEAILGPRPSSDGWNEAILGPRPTGGADAAAPGEIDALRETADGFRNPLEYQADGALAVGSSFARLGRQGVQAIDWFNQATGYNWLQDTLFGAGTAAAGASEAASPFASAEAFMADQQSDELKARREIRSRELAEGGVANTAAAYGEYPSLLLDDLFGQSATLAAQAATGMGSNAVALSVGVSKTMSGAIGTMIGATSAGALEGGDVRVEMLKKFDKLTDEQWEASTVYQSAIAAGAEPADAKKRISEAAAMQAAEVTTAAVAATSVIPGMNMVDKLAAGVGRQAAGKAGSVAAASAAGAGRGAAAEAAQETSAGALSQMEQNRQLGAVDGTTGLTDGMADRAVGDAILGATVGGAIRGGVDAVGQAAENDAIAAEDGERRDVDAFLAEAAEFDAARGEAQAEADYAAAQARRRDGVALEYDGGYAEPATTVVPGTRDAIELPDEDRVAARGANQAAGSEIAAARTDQLAADFDEALAIDEYRSGRAVPDDQFGLDLQFEEEVRRLTDINFAEKIRNLESVFPDALDGARTVTERVDIAGSFAAARKAVGEDKTEAAKIRKALTTDFPAERAKVEAERRTEIAAAAKKDASNLDAPIAAELRAASRLEALDELEAIADSERPDAPGDGYRGSAITDAESDAQLAQDLDTGIDFRAERERLRTNFTARIERSTKPETKARLKIQQREALADLAERQDRVEVAQAERVPAATSTDGLDIDTDQAPELSGAPVADTDPSTPTEREADFRESEADRQRRETEFDTTRPVDDDGSLGGTTETAGSVRPNPAGDQNEARGYRGEVQLPQGNDPNRRQPEDGDRDRSQRDEDVASDERRQGQEPEDGSRERGDDGDGTDDRRRRQVSEPVGRAKSLLARTTRGLRRNFTSAGLRPAAVDKAMRQADGEKGLGAYDAAVIGRRTQKRLAKLMGKKAYKNISPEFRAKMNDHLAGKDTDLSSDVKAAMQDQRDYLDARSSAIADAHDGMARERASRLSPEKRQAIKDGLDAGDLDPVTAGVKAMMDRAALIRGNIGAYVNTAYEAFDNPRWPVTARADAQLMDEAFAFFAKENPDLSSPQVQGLIDKVLDTARLSSDLADFASGGKLNAKNQAIFKKRKDVPDVIARLLGRYTDPQVNFQRSADKMTQWLANHTFMTKLAEGGSGTWLFDTPVTSELGRFSVQIASDNSQTLAPLNGLYTSEDFLQGLMDANETVQYGPSELQVRRVNAAGKYGMTVLAPTTMARNLISGSMNLVANGHYDIRSAVRSAVANTDFARKNDSKWSDLIRRAVELRVLNNDATSGELRAIMNEVNADSISNVPWLGGMLKGGLEVSQQAYRFGDDFWRMIAWQSEINRFMNEGGLPREDAEVIAAERVNNTTQSYDMVPRAVDKVRSAWLIGMFVSFVSETVRNTYWQAKYVRQDFAEGRPKMARDRLIGMNIAHSWAYVASGVSMMVHGIDMEEDDFMGKQGAPWGRQGQRLYTGRDENNMPEYIDLSFMDLFGYTRKWMSALNDTGAMSVNEKLKNAAVEILGPFLGMEIVPSTFIEQIMNKKMEGGRVYRETDTFSGKAHDRAIHVFDNTRPGFMGNGERIFKAIRGDVSKYGKEYDLGDELLALIGIRATTMNPRQSLTFQGSQFKSAIMDASGIINDVRTTQSITSDAKIERAFKSATRAREKAFAELSYAWNGWLKWGMPPGEAAAALKDAQVSDDDIKAIIAGRVPPWTPTERSIARNLNRQQFLSPDQSPERQREIAETARNRDLLLLELRRMQILEEQERVDNP